MGLAERRGMAPRFPLRASRGVGAARAGDRASRASGSGVMPRPQRVLLVDDDNDTRALCAEHLGTAGFEVLQAANGAEAIAMAIQRKPDIVVMDLEMPVMGGLEAIQRLRGDDRTRAIPIVVLSANGDVDHAKVKRAGCDICLVKPCRLDDLEGVIRALLDMYPVELASRDSGAG